MSPDAGTAGDAQGVSLSCLKRVGNTIHLIDDTGTHHICYPNGGGMWIPPDYSFITPDSGQSDVDVDPDPDPGADDGDATIQGKLIAWHKKYLGLFHYSQSLSGRLNPVKSGYTDCSGLQYACYKAVMGINVGTNSRDQANKSIGVTVTTKRSEILYGTGMQKGDLIFYAHPNENWSHVEMYMGNKKVIGISNTSEDGPRIQALSLQVNYFKGRLKVKRYT